MGYCIFELLFFLFSYALLTWNIFFGFAFCCFSSFSIFLACVLLLVELVFAIGASADSEGGRHLPAFCPRRKTRTVPLGFLFLFSMKSSEPKSS